MAATSSEAFLLELAAEGPGCEWIKSERYQLLEERKAVERSKNNPVKTCVLKFDHFENIHRLPKDALAFDGAPNFRQVPGYLVFGTGQPTRDGFTSALDHIFKETGAKKVLWTNMRQEPVVYLNGQSFTPRLPEKMNENMEFPGLAGEDIEWLQSEFVDTIRGRVEASKEDRWIDKADRGKVKYYRDTYAEHPEDRENIEYSVYMEDDKALVTLSGMYDQQKEHGFNLAYARLPIVDEKAPREEDFDQILNELRAEPEDTGCVFNCQMGKGRTTTGMIIACLVKDVLFGGDAVISKFKAETKIDPKNFSDEDEFEEEVAKKGQFAVLEKLYLYVPEGREAKAHLDHIIDLCGTPPQGTGLQNLRECIQWTREKMDFERVKLKKPFWRLMSQNFIERYFYLVCFATYLRIQVKQNFTWSFQQWMDQRAELREIISNAKKNFEWK